MLINVMHKANKNIWVPSASHGLAPHFGGVRPPVARLCPPFFSPHFSLPAVPPSHLPTVPSLLNFFVISFHPFLSVLQCSTMLTPHAVNRLNQNPSMEDVFGKNIVGSFWGSSVLPHAACKVWCMTYFAEKVAVIFVSLKPDQLNMPSITAVYGFGTPE